MMIVTVIGEGSTIEDMSAMAKSTTIRVVTDTITVKVMTKKGTTRTGDGTGMIRRSITKGTADTEAPHQGAVTEVVADCEFAERNKHH